MALSAQNIVPSKSLLQFGKIETNEKVENATCRE